MGRRSELKENILASKVEDALKWAIDRKAQVLTVLGFIFVSFLVGSVFVLRMREAQENNWSQLAFGQALFEQRQYDKSLAVLTELQSKNPDTNAAIYTAFYLGELYLATNKPDEAIENFTRAVDLSPSLPIHPLALSNLGFSYERKRDFESAAQSYQTFMDQYGDHFMAARTQLALGRSLAKAGQNEAAESALNQLIDLYPTSFWAENARRILDKIETR